MSTITVGLDEHNHACGKMTLLHPPGGESHMAGICGIPDSPPSKLALKISQPPGGASADIFSASSDSASDTGSENGEAEPVKKIYRCYEETPSRTLRENSVRMLASSFVLGDQQPETQPKVLKKMSVPALNPITGEEVDSVVVTPPKPAAKTTRQPPGGRSSILW